MPGDFALYPDASHVGMIVGRNAAERLLVYHCLYRTNSVDGVNVQWRGQRHASPPLRVHMKVKSNTPVGGTLLYQRYTAICRR